MLTSGGVLVTGQTLIAKYTGAVDAGSSILGDPASGATKAAADIKGSRNVIGVKNPAVDKLIDRVIFAKDREELAAATRALDRVLLWSNYVVPQWYSPYERIAYWNKFKRPEKLPSRSASFLQVWWSDKAQGQ